MYLTNVYMYIFFYDPQTIVYFLLTPWYTHAGFDLATRITAVEEESTKPRRQFKTDFCSLLAQPLLMARLSRLATPPAQLDSK
jgi:hypothetical protein